MTSVTTRTSQISPSRAPLSRFSDQELLRSFAERRSISSERDFAELVRRLGPMVLGICRDLLRDSHAADNAFQATFLVLARKAGSIDRLELLAHWLQGEAFRVSRQARVRDERLARRETVETVRQEVARLPEKYRRVPRDVLNPCRGRC